MPVVAPLYAALDELERGADDQRRVDGVVRRRPPPGAQLHRRARAVLDHPLIHGDLHFQNVLWDGFSVTALLDLEWARGAPPDLDLDVFLRFCAHPHWFVAPEYADRTRVEDYAAVPYWFAEFYPELFAHEYELDRTELYSIAYDVRDLLDEVKREADRRLDTRSAGMASAQAARGHDLQPQPPAPPRRPDRVGRTGLR